MRRVALLVVVAAMLAGCSAREPTPTPTPSLAKVFRDEVDRFLHSGDTSDLQRAILADYWVTDAEMREAEDAMRTCLTGAHPDLTVTFKPDGGYDIGPADLFYAQYGEELGGQKFDEIVSDCAGSTVDRIQELYVEPRRNPEGLTYPQLVRRCFEKHGIDDARDLSDQELQELIGSSDYSPSAEARACAMNPYGS